MEDGVTVLDGAVPEEVADQEFEDQPVGGVVRHSLLLVLPDLAIRIRGRKRERNTFFVFAPRWSAARGDKEREDFFFLFLSLVAGNVGWLPWEG